MATATATAAPTPAPPADGAPAPSSPFKMTASSGGSFDLCPAGNHPAVLIAVIDLGTHTDEYQGKQMDSRQGVLVWELPGEIKPNGEPFVLAKQYNLYFSPTSKLRQMVEGWRGKKFADGEPFDLEALLSKPCLINVVHKAGKNNKTYHEVGGVSNLPRGMTAPRNSYPTFLYVVGGPLPVPADDWLPYIYGEPVADIIGRCHEVKAGAPAVGVDAAAPAAGNEVTKPEDDIPF